MYKNFHINKTTAIFCKKELQLCIGNYHHFICIFSSSVCSFLGPPSLYTYILLPSIPLHLSPYPSFPEGPHGGKNPSSAKSPEPSLELRHREMARSLHRARSVGAPTHPLPQQPPRLCTHVVVLHAPSTASSAPLPPRLLSIVTSQSLLYGPNVARPLFLPTIRP